MKAIAAIDSEFGIGADGKLLFHIKEDLKRFSELTKNNVIVMGRKTFESLPNKQPLKNRINIIMTRNKDYYIDGCIVVHSDEELLNELKKYNCDSIFIIGGGEIYNKYAHLCTDIYLTHVYANFNADTFFPKSILKNYSQDLTYDDFKEHYTEDGHKYIFTRYINKYTIHYY